MQQTFSATPVVWIVEDNTTVAESIGAVCESQGWSIETFYSAETFIASDFRSKMGCLVLDVNLPGQSGLELQTWLNGKSSMVPLVLISGYADVETAVTGMRHGAVTLLQKPFDPEQLIAAVQEAFGIIQLRIAESGTRSRNAELVAALNRSELETAELIVNGKSNKQIAAIQGLSVRGVEDRRRRLMKHFETRSLAEFVSAAKSALASR